MKMIRFVLPFLFVRNWYDGAWELSRARMILFCAFMLLIFMGGLVAYVLQAPVYYDSTP